jgi:ribosomal-protein-alanine acetyltransferase
MKRRKNAPGFVVSWEFRVRPAKRKAFEKVYGPEGDWVKLFRRDPAYVRTELIRDRDKPARYMTLDFWSSRKAYQQFKKKNREEYSAIDQKCGSLTLYEKLLGEFDYIARLSTNAIPIKENASYPGHNSEIQIRMASTEQIPAILELERETAPAAHWPEPTYRRMFEQETPRCLAFAAVNENAGNDRELSGFVIGRISDDECELENIVVRRQSQSQGIGSRLVHKLVDAARQHKATKVFLEVRESNSAARGLYEKCGFRITGRRRMYYTNPAEDALLYALDLQLNLSPDFLVR